MFAPRGWLKRPVPRMIYRTIESSQLFDASWYRSSNMALYEKLMDPLWHYLDIGWKKGLNPSVFFDNDYYLQTNPDVKELGLNPLFHYLKYGVGEQRHPLETGLQALHAHFGPAAPLTLLSVPKTNTSRTTLLVDDFTPRDSHLPYWSVIGMGALIANDSQSRLRVIDRRTTQTFLPISEVLAAVGIELSHGFEIIRVALSPRFHEVTAYPQEVFIATSFSSHLALSPVPTPQRRYLITDYEPRLYGDSLIGHLANRATEDNGVKRSALGATGQAVNSQGSERATWTVVAKPEQKKKSSPPHTKTTIGVDVDPLATGQLVAATLEALEYAIKQGVIDPEAHRIVFIGDTTRVTNLVASLVPEHARCENVHDVEDLAHSVDVLVSLARPHALGILDRSVVAAGGQLVTRASGEGLSSVHQVDTVSATAVATHIASALKHSVAKQGAPRLLNHTVGFGA